MSCQRCVNSVLVGAAIVGAAAMVAAQARPNVKPREGYVPTANTAVAIGVAVLEPIYGEQNLARHKPYKATLADGIWTVRGTLPPGTAGGTAVAEISKDDGRILRVFHEQ
jgi:hypothetical protein